jgi:hypothetical protein
LLYCQYGSPVAQALHFIGSSLKDLQRLPEEVQDVFGSALLDAQYGDEPDGSRPFGEGLPKTVRKLAEDRSARVSQEVEVRHCDAAAGPRVGTRPFPNGCGPLRTGVWQIGRPGGRAVWTHATNAASARDQRG